VLVIDHEYARPLAGRPGCGLAFGGQAGFGRPVSGLALWWLHVECFLMVSDGPVHVQVVAYLTHPPNGHCDRLRDLFQVVAGDTTCEDDEPSIRGDLDAAQ
jgi:hypothetical protein